MSLPERVPYETLGGSVRLCRTIPNEHQATRLRVVYERNEPFHATLQFVSAAAGLFIMHDVATRRRYFLNPSYMVSDLLPANIIVGNQVTADWVIQKTGQAFSLRLR